MNTERTSELERRAAVHAALADPARLQIVDTLTVGDASPSELAVMLSMPSNLVAHHLNALDAVGLITRTRSEGDRRRSYLRLAPDALDGLGDAPVRATRRVLFVCTANSARSHLAAALWRRASDVPVASAGTHPADGIDPGAIAAAHRHRLPLRRLRPRRLDEVQADGDLIITVCDLAHEELSGLSALHWSVPDPVRTGSDTAFDQALDDLTRRVDELAPRITETPVAS
jgi:protein-tyrosine-phosphatase/DNA-binding HxlR family transcriptional regulator